MLDWINLRLRRWRNFNCA